MFAESDKKTVVIALHGCGYHAGIAWLTEVTILSDLQPKQSTFGQILFLGLPLLWMKNFPELRDQCCLIRQTGDGCADRRLDGG